MVEVYNDEEQVERIKEWLNEYALTVIVSVIIVAVSFFSWRYWQNHRETQRAKASIYYEQLLASTASNDYVAAQGGAENLMQNYASTPYAKLAALLLAKINAEQADYAQAAENLQWVIKHAKTKAIKQIARNRKARILIGENKPEQAIQVLSVEDDKAYLPAIASIRGDAYVAAKQFSKARKAYQAALLSLPKNSASWPLLEMKLNNLAVQNNSTSNYSGKLKESLKS